MIGKRSKARQVLRDSRAGNAGGNGLKLAADFRRRVGFQVPNVEVRRSAVVEDEDTGLRLAEVSGARLGYRPSARCVRRTQPVGPQQPGEAETANPHGLAPGNAVA